MYVIVVPTAPWNEMELKHFYSSVVLCDYADISRLTVEQMIKDDLACPCHEYVFRVPKKRLKQKRFEQMLRGLEVGCDIRVKRLPTMGFLRWRVRKAHEKHTS